MIIHSSILVIKWLAYFCEESTWKYRNSMRMPLNAFHPKISGFSLCLSPTPTPPLSTFCDGNIDPSAAFQPSTLNHQPSTIHLIPSIKVDREKGRGTYCQTLIYTSRPFSQLFFSSNSLFFQQLCQLNMKSCQERGGESTPQVNSFVQTIYSDFSRDSYQ